MFMRMQVRSLALFIGLRIWHCHELRHKSQMQLGSRTAVAVTLADSRSSDSPPSLCERERREAGRPEGMMKW